jgi:phytanoyl-CoA hydroxylase
MATGLSSTDIDDYREHGYVIVPEVLRPDEIERYRQRARAIALGDHPADAASRLVRDVRFAKGVLPMPADPERALWKIMNPDRFDTVLAECLRLPRLLDAVASVIGEDLLAFLLMVVYKPPGVEDAVHPFHQDALFFEFEPHDRVVGAWIALDGAHADNGSLCIIPGSHRLPVGRHGELAGVNKYAFAAAGVEGNESCHASAITLDLAPGACVLFHPHLYHRTGGNRTQEHRRVITLHFASAECRPTAKALPREFGFTSVRGTTYDGCLQPLAATDPGLRFY